VRGGRLDAVDSIPRLGAVGGGEEDDGVSHGRSGSRTGLG